MPKFYKRGDTTKREISITNDKDNFFQLSNGEMIKKDVFNKYFEAVNDAPLTESVNTRSNPFHSPNDGSSMNPDDFFNTMPLASADLEKLKNTNTSQMNDMPQDARINRNNTNQTSHQQPQQTNQPTQGDAYLNEPIIRQDPNPQIPNNTNTDVSQYKVYDNDDDAYADFVSKGNQTQPQQTQTQTQAPELSEDQVVFENEKMAFGEEEAIVRRNIRIKRNLIVPADVVVNVPKVAPQPVNDPVINMFRTIKRNHDVEINITFEDKIGNPDFVKMMLEIGRAHV